MTIHLDTLHYIKLYQAFYQFSVTLSSISPSIARTRERHTSKIIIINPIKEFITRNLIWSSSTFAIISRENNIKIS